MQNISMTVGLMDFFSEKIPNIVHDNCSHRHNSEAYAVLLDIHIQNESASYVIF